MANEKTINLAGSEVEVKLSGQNCDIRNDGTDTVYASRRANVAGGADGVVSIPAGQAVKLLDTCGTVYLNGTGSVLLCGNDYGYLVFKTAAALSGDGGVDQTARDAINAHAGNTDIHLSAKDVAGLVSNPNLLINPDFRINQRGEASYGAGVYCVDGWRMGYSTTCEVGDGYIDVTQSKDGGSLWWEYIENPDRYAGETVTLSVCCELVEGDGTVFIGALDNSTEGSVTTGTWRSMQGTATASPQVFTLTAEISDGLNQVAFRPEVADSKIRFYWAKLELGGIATPFIPPDPATELAKCQRRYKRFQGLYKHLGSGYLASSAAAAVVISLPTTMRAAPTVNLSGTVHINTFGANGSTALEATEILSLSASEDVVTVGFSVAGGTGGYGCAAQLRDADSYIEMSAEL